MLKNKKNGYLLSVIVLLFVVSFSDYAIADWIEFPLDNGGYALISIDRNRLHLWGMELGEDAPAWQDLLTWKGPGCAIIAQEDHWICDNPWVDGEISTAFYYIITVMFPKGCEGRICFSITGYPEYGEICIEDEAGGVSIEIDILDICDNPVKYRLNNMASFVDMEESVVFFAQLRSPDEEMEFPMELEGVVIGGGQVFPNISLFQTYSEPGCAEYKSGDFITRSFFSSYPKGNLIFRLSHGQGAIQSIYAKEIKFAIDDDELNFTNNVEIEGYSSNTVCYPGGSFLSFGATVEIYEDGWPYPCETFNGDIKGFDGGEHIITTGAIISQGGFTTIPAQSSYEVGQYYDYEEIHLNWKASVDNGPDRDAKPLSTAIRIYHGFSASGIIIDDPPPYNIFPCDTDIDLEANPIPNLAYQDRIIYCWQSDPPELGNFGPNNCDQARQTCFHAEGPGDVEIWYYIEDVITGYRSDPSNPLTLHLAQITITSPSNADKFTFSPDSTGVITHTATAAILPPSIIDYVIWTFDPIGNSNLSTDPDPPTGQRVKFKYEGLPEKNTDFGEKLITASVPQTQISNTVEIEVYFPKIATNHPNGSEPNWYYYWSRSGAGLGYSIYDGIECIPEATGYFFWHYYDWAETYYHLCEKAGQSVLFNGRIYDGIDCFGTSSLHENEHYDNWWLSWCSACPYDPVTDDPDSDYVPTYRENTIYHTDPNNDYTFWPLWDQDYIGYWANLKWVMHSKDPEDWANPGHQY